MKFRHIVLAIAGVAALSPAISNASPEKASMKACADAFATRFSSPDGTAPDYKLAYRRGELMTSSLAYARDYAFMLEAHDKSGMPIARARCLADSRGVVTSISAVPLADKF